MSQIDFAKEKETLFKLRLASFASTLGFFHFLSPAAIDTPKSTISNLKHAGQVLDQMRAREALRDRSQLLPRAHYLLTAVARTWSRGVTRSTSRVKKLTQYDPASPSRWVACAEQAPKALWRRVHYFDFHSSSNNFYLYLSFLTKSQIWQVYWIYFICFSQIWIFAGIFNPLSAGVRIDLFSRRPYWFARSTIS